MLIKSTCSPSFSLNQESTTVRNQGNIRRKTQNLAKAASAKLDAHIIFPHYLHILSMTNWNSLPLSILLQFCYINIFKSWMEKQFLNENHSGTALQSYLYNLRKRTAVRKVKVNSHADSILTYCCVCDVVRTLRDAKAYQQEWMLAFE